MARAGTTSPDRLAAALVQGAVAAGGLLVCTDFDGSLAPIVRRPDDARALPRAMAAVAWLTRRGARDGVGARCPVGLAQSYISNHISLRWFGSGICYAGKNRRRNSRDIDGEGTEGFVVMGAR